MRGRTGWWRRLRLSTQILLLQLAVIVLTLTAGLGVSIYQARAQLNERSGEQSLAIARTVAAFPEVRRAFARPPDPRSEVQRVAERVRRSARASFVVVADNRGIRYSHPDPAKIGHRLSTDPSLALAGREYVGVQTGTLGTSVRAKVPIYGSGGRVVGLVSVGILQTKVSEHLREDLPLLSIPPALGLLLGIAGSLLVARRIKRQTFGLEPDEIGALLEQREAMLHAIKEGTVTVDAGGRVTLVNDEARRLLDLDASAVGKRLAEIVPPGHVREVLAGHVEGPDQVVLVNDRVLLVNRIPVQIRGKAIGAVVTLRDRTELEGLLRELADVRGFADALRAQEHDFSHKLHVVAGLIELGRHDDAIRFINESALVQQELVGAIVDPVGDPIIAALLLGKAAVAAERRIELRLVESGLPNEQPGAADLVTVIGNLIDNALESVAAGGWVEVTIRDEGNGVYVRVHDSGPGIDSTVIDEIFHDGFTTKVANRTGRRGLGLALVTQAVRRRGGTIDVRNEGGAVFTAFVPHVGEPAGAPS